MANIVAALAGGDARNGIWAQGIHVAGERFVVSRADERSIYGRHV